MVDLTPAVDTHESADLPRQAGALAVPGGARDGLDRFKDTTGKGLERVKQLRAEFIDTVDNELRNLAPEPRLVQPECKYPYKEFSDAKLVETGDVSINDVNQGDLGDCWFLASCAAIAHVAPERIGEMVVARGDGTFDIHLYMGPKLADGTAERQTFHVDSSFPVKDATNLIADPAFAHSADGAKVTWPSLLEKGMAGSMGSYEAMDGNNARTAFGAMLGGSSEEYRPWIVKQDMSPENVAYEPSYFDEDEYSAVQEALTAKRPATASIKSPDHPSQQAAFDALRLVGGHAYALIDLDVVGNRIRLYNPWGFQHVDAPLSDVAPFLRMFTVAPTR